MNAMTTLIRREFWEHRSLIIAPLAVAALLFVVAAIGSRHVEFGHLRLMNPDEQIAAIAVVQWLSSTPLFMVTLIVLFFYLIDCLYAERKDRSILFWKSLPVSDASTVISKLLVALVITPLLVYAIATVTHLLALAVWAVRFAGEDVELWDTGTWLSVHAFMLTWLVVAMLWYLPTAAYLMLVSAWARRNVFLWAVLPPLLAMMVEEIAFDTSYVGAFIGQRLTGFFEAFDPVGNAEHHFFEEYTPGEQATTLRERLGVTDLALVFTHPHLWIGLVLGPALLYGAIRIRRYRDDT